MDSDWQSVRAHAISVRDYLKDVSSDPYRYHAIAMLSLDYIISVAVSHLTPVASDGAGEQTGDVEGETRPAPEHNG